MQPGKQMVRIHALSEDDWPLLKNARLGAVRESPNAYCQKDVQEEVDWQEEDWKLELKRRRWVAALVGPQCVGIASMMEQTFGEHLCLCVEKVWTRPEWRRMGVARRMISVLIFLHAPIGGRRIILSVLETNPSAERAYTNMGFLPSGDTHAEGVQPCGDAVPETEMRLPDQVISTFLAEAQAACMDSL